MTAKFKVGDTVFLVNSRGSYGIPDECWGVGNEYIVRHVGNVHPTEGQNYTLHHRVKGADWGWSAYEYMLDEAGGPW